MKRERVRVAITVCSVALAGLALASNARAQCSRETLQKLADTYVKAQTDGKATMLPLAAGASYAENDKAMDVAKGVLAGPLKVDFTRSFHDTTQCATFTELVAATDPHPYVILTRMEATTDGKVSKMESVVTDADDWVFGATQYLEFTKAEKWDEIPTDKRDTREAIQMAAESYINHWGDPTLTVLHGTPCARLEGRIYTAAPPRGNPEAQSCSMPAFPQKIKTGHRRFVIDETIGAVVIFHDFSWIDSGLPADHPGTPAGQMFRVEGGKNRYIHEVTACTTANCGRGGGRGGPGAGAPRGPGAPGAPGAGAPRGPGAPGGAAPRGQGAPGAGAPRGPGLPGGE